MMIIGFIFAEIITGCSRVISKFKPWGKRKKFSFSWLKQQVSKTEYCESDILQKNSNRHPFCYDAIF